MNNQPLFATLLESQTDLMEVSAGLNTAGKEISIGKVTTDVLADQLITSPSQDGLIVTCAYPSDTDTIDPRALPLD